MSKVLVTIFGIALVVVGVWFVIFTFDLGKVEKDDTSNNLPKGLAGCRLEGEVTFLDLFTAAHETDKFSYWGVDDPSRNVHWTIEPDDDLQVAPDIIDRLPVPEGESIVYVSLPEKPIAKEYFLTANLDYGYLNDAGVLLNANVDCEGKVKVTLP